MSAQGGSNVRGSRQVIGHDLDDQFEKMEFCWSCQEQSEVPSIQSSRTQEMYPAAHGARRRRPTGRRGTDLFHHLGIPRWFTTNGIQLVSMQAQIDNGYLVTAQAFSMSVAPVGVAWFHIRDQYPQINLWQDDGSHPTTEGTYLRGVCFLRRYLSSKPGRIIVSG